MSMVKQHIDHIAPIAC